MMSFTAFASPADRQSTNLHTLARWCCLTYDKFATDATFLLADGTIRAIRSAGVNARTDAIAGEQDAR
jgi:hypothetical protein